MGVAKTIVALESAGHRLLEPPDEDRLVGPFHAINSSGNRYEIADQKGKVAIWVVGAELADKLVRLVNLAYHHGKL